MVTKCAAFWLVLLQVACSGAAEGPSHTARSLTTEDEGGQEIIEIVSGSDHSCVLRRSGDVLCWGANGSGQLGVENRDLKTSFWAEARRVEGLPSEIEHLTAGERHTCALSKGSVYCWGANGLGQIGQQTTSPRIQPMKVSGIAGAKQLASGHWHNCALVDGGDILCWGSNKSRQLGAKKLFTIEIPLPVPEIDDAVLVAAGGNQSCALRQNGELLCWGKAARTGALQEPQIVGVRGVSDAVSLKLGEDFGCFIAKGGEVTCWGHGQSGQLGRELTDVSNSTAPITGLSRVDSLSCGDHHACALRRDGRLACWGSNVAGQLGQGTTTNAFAPSEVEGLGHISGVALGRSHTCAVSASKTVHCFGLGTSGQLGVELERFGETVVSRPEPAPALDGLTDMALGAFHGCARRDGMVVCWGSDEWGQLGDGQEPVRSALVVVDGLDEGSPVEEVVSGFAHSCARRHDGSILCWGRNLYGELGDGTREHRVSPVRVSGIDDALQVSTNGASSLTCARHSDGHLSCWGGHSEHSDLDHSGWSSASPVKVGDIDDVVDLAVAPAHLCALRASAKLSCFHIPPYERSESPHPLPDIEEGLEGVSGLISGGRTTCARYQDGAVRCIEGGWKMGPPIKGLTPTSELAMGDYHRCATDQKGVVRCWGTTRYGNLGNGNPYHGGVRDPEVVAGIDDVVELAAGANHSCVRDRQGKVSCWGRRLAGMFGGALPLRTFPVKVLGIDGSHDG